MNITADGAALKEMERQMQISEDILRYLSIKVDAHETGPSALLKSSRYVREDSYHNRSSDNDDQSASTANEGASV